MKRWKGKSYLADGTSLTYNRDGGNTKTLFALSDVKKVQQHADKRPHCFRVDLKSGRTIVLAAGSDAERDRWMEAIKPAGGASPATSSTVQSVPSSSAVVPPAPVSGGSPSSSRPQSMSLLPAKPSVDDFDFIAKIGAGTYGKVYLVRSKMGQRFYALKVMSKRVLQETDTVEQTMIEREVFQKARHPFLVAAQAVWQAPEKVFMLLDFIPGGELFGRLKEEYRFSEERVRQYTAELTLALEHLHGLNFVYRDLKPENILIDRDGHLRLTDFGLVKANMTEGVTTRTLCGTAEYLAPEAILAQPYDKAVDIWALGVLMCEMLTGQTPWYDDNRDRMFKKIVNNPLIFPDAVPPHAESLMRRLLEKDPKKRATMPEIKKHPFFTPLGGWQKVLDKQIEPAWIPDDELQGDGDIKLIDPEFTQQAAAMSYEDASCVDVATQRGLEGFTWIAPSALGGV